jgi:hypothetical protein
VRNQLLLFTCIAPGLLLASSALVCDGERGSPARVDPVPAAAPSPRVDATVPVVSIEPAGPMPGAQPGPELFRRGRLLLDRSGNLVLVDGRRLYRLARDFEALATFELPFGAIDAVAVSDLGEVVVEGDGQLAILDATGAERARFESPPGGEPIAILLDGREVYVELSEHQLLKVGDLDGNPDGSSKALDGWPSRDGSALVDAWVIDAPTETMQVYSRERGGDVDLFSTTLHGSFRGVLRVDTDDAGVVHLVSVAEDGAVRLDCLDPRDGSALGGADLVEAEASQPLAVLGEGGVLYLVEGASGPELRQVACQ